MSKLLLELCHCVYRIDSVEFREKIDVPIHIAKTLSEFIQFVESVHRTLDPSKGSDQGKATLQKLTKHFSRLARDYTMQTKVGMYLEKLFYMDVASCSPDQVLDLGVSFGDIEGAGSNVFWLYANRNAMEMIDNTKIEGQGPVDPSQPFMTVAQAEKLIHVINRVNTKALGRRQFFYRKSTQ